LLLGSALFLLRLFFSELLEGLDMLGAAQQAGEPRRDRFHGERASERGTDVVLSDNVVVWKFQCADGASVAAVEKCHGLQTVLT
jgi:hypothetical protein